MISSSSVVSVIGMTLLGLAVLMLVPTAFAWYLGSRDLEAFGISVVVTAVVAVFMISRRRVAVPHLRVREMYLLTVGSWLGVCAFGGLPFLLSHTVDSATDAIFESMSGVTTTGATVLTGLDAMPRDILLWRSMMQWIGGLGIIALGVAVLPFLRVGGMRLFKTESSDFSEKSLPLTRGILMRLLLVYLCVSAACAAGYYLGGMDAFDALNHAMTTVSTGGFSTHDSSIAYFDSRPIRTIAVVFMLIAAMPFALYLPFLAGRFRQVFRDGQVRSLLGSYASVAAILVIWLLYSGQYAESGGVLDVIFSVVSIGTTTGYVSVDYESWGSFAVISLFFLTFVGGCAGSTSGGIKIFRFKIAFVMLRENVQRLLHPSAIIARQTEGRQISDDIVASVSAFSLIFACTVGCVAVLLAFAGNDFVTSFSAAATATANVGPGFGDQIGPVLNFAGLSDISKWILCVAMLLGRLEILTVLMLLTPSFWVA